MGGFLVEEAPGGLRLRPVVRRQLGSEAFTWAELLHQRLGQVQVYVLYFPSRFNLPVDTSVQDALRVFGHQTAAHTSVNFWDSADPEFTTALGFFQQAAPPALVLVTGHLVVAGKRSTTDQANLYSIVISDDAVLKDHDRLAVAVNAAHEVLVRGNRREITRYLQMRDATSLLDGIAAIAGGMRDELLKFKPKIGLPGGISIQLGA